MALASTENAVETTTATAFASEEMGAASFVGNSFFNVSHVCSLPGERGSARRVRAAILTPTACRHIMMLGRSKLIPSEVACAAPVSHLCTRFVYANMGVEG